MKVILTDDVVGVGDIGENVKVRAGYARNFLIPRGLAIESGSVSARQAEHRMRQIDAKKRRLKKSAEELGDSVKAAKVELELRVGSGGKVFGSIGAKDIAAKLEEKGFSIDRRRILLSDPIKKIGTHQVLAKLHAEVKVEIDVTVKGLAATKEQEETETQQARQAIEEASAQAAFESQDDLEYSSGEEESVEETPAAAAQEEE